MKPLRFAFGERVYEDNGSRIHHAFDHFYEDRSDQYNLSLTVQLRKKDDTGNSIDYSTIKTFQNGPLLKSIGNFIANINSALDKDNQIDVYIPNPEGSSFSVLGNNGITLSHAKESLEAILDAYTANLGNQDFDPRQIVKPIVDRAKKFFDCYAVFNSLQFKEYAPSSSDIIMKRYLDGIILERLELPPRDASYFELKHPLIKHDIVKPEIGVSAAEITMREVLHEERCRAFQKLKAFLHGRLDVTLSVNREYPRTVTIVGAIDDVSLAENIGKRTASLINNNRPINNKFLDDALADAKKDALIARTCKAANVEEIAKLKKPLRLREPA